MNQKSKLVVAFENGDLKAVENCLKNGDAVDLGACKRFKESLEDKLRQCDNKSDYDQIYKFYERVCECCKAIHEVEAKRRDANADKMIAEEDSKKKQKKQKPKRLPAKAEEVAKRNATMNNTDGTDTSSAQTRARTMNEQTLGETTTVTTPPPPVVVKKEESVVDSGDLEETKPPKGQEKPPASSSTMETQAQEAKAGTCDFNEQGDSSNGNEDSTGFSPVVGNKSANPKNKSPLKLDEGAVATALEEPFVFKEVDLEAVPPRMATTPQAFLELASEDLSAAHSVTASNHIYKAFTSLVDVFGSNCGFTIHTARGYRILGKEFCPRKISQFFNAKAKTRDEFLDATKKRDDFEDGMDNILQCHRNFHKEHMNKAFVNKAGTAAAKLLTDFRVYYKEGVFDRFDEFTVEWAKNGRFGLQYFDVTRH